MVEFGYSLAASSIVILVLLAIMGVITYVLSARKTNARKQFLADLHTNLKPGKRVMFGGGIFGTATKVGDEVVEVKVKDGATFDVSRFAIQEVLDD